MNYVVLLQALLLAPSTRRTTTTGEIVNLMAVDAQKIHDFCCFIHEMWACFFNLCLAVSLLYLIIGPVAFASLVLVFIFLPINSMVMGKLYINLQVSLLYLLYRAYNFFEL